MIAFEQETITISINIATLIFLVKVLWQINNAIVRLTAIQEQHEKRLEKLEKINKLQEVIK